MPNYITRCTELLFHYRFQKTTFSYLLLSIVKAKRFVPIKVFTYSLREKKQDMRIILLGILSLVLVKGPFKKRY